MNGNIGHCKSILLRTVNRQRRWDGNHRVADYFAMRYYLDIVIVVIFARLSDKASYKSIYAAIEASASQFMRSILREQSVCH